MPSDLSEIVDEFRETLTDCRRLYIEAGRRCVSDYPQFVRKSPQEFIQWMDDLHKGLLVKGLHGYGVIGSALASGRTPTGPGAARSHLARRSVRGSQLREAARGLSERARRLTLFSLIRPFAEIAPLRDHVGELETVVMRLANLVAKADQRFLGQRGPMRPIRCRKRCSRTCLTCPWIPPASTKRAAPARSRAVRTLQRDAQQIQQECELAGAASCGTAARRPARTIAAGVAQLEQLVGLEPIKREIRTLTNYLKVQRHREQAGLPRTPLSLHMVFAGNPGTGKTTVARIVGQILGGMGILTKGHLIETDRSGLVAEYAGQTGPKTNALIDQAIDGVLFIDEAYSLVAEQSEDAFGREALQTLMKRMEDERDRLVVVLAGYSQPMEQTAVGKPRDSHPASAAPCNSTTITPDRAGTDLRTDVRRKSLPDSRRKSATDCCWASPGCTSSGTNDLATAAWSATCSRMRFADWQTAWPMFRRSRADC